MTLETVTLLWIIDGEPSSSARLAEQLRDSRIKVVAIRETDLEGAIAKARVCGAVVAVGACTAVSRMLQSGVDEAVGWTSTSQELSEAVANARARARYRAATEAVDSVELAGLAFMSAVIAHEVRNQLTVATINCTTVRALVSPLDAQSELHAALVDLDEAIREVAEVVRRMRALTDPGEAGVCDVCQTLIELAAYLRREMEFAADFDVDVPNTPCPVAVSRIRLIEVVASVLNGAVFAVERLVERRANITLRLAVEGEMVVVDVTDNGVGMTPEVRERVVNPVSTPLRPAALGMGLAFAAIQVRRVGGEMQIESQEGVGTSVRLCFPRIRELSSSATRTTAN